MATITDSSEAPSKQIKPEDFVQLMNIFASEFNSDSLHDRVLIFEVVEQSGEESEPESETSEQSKDSQDSKGKAESEADTFEIDTNNGGEIECNSNQEEKSCQCETSKDNESISDAGMEPSGKIDGIVDDDEKKSIVLDSPAILRPEVAEQKLQNTSGNETEVNRSKDHDVDGENKTKLFVHSSWLAVHSSYFRALFYSGMKETHSKEVVMKIQQSELQSHLILIEAMYKLDVLDDKECSLVVDVLALADKYDVNLVFKKCKYVLISTFICLEDCDYILKITSDIPECGDIYDAMEKYLVKEFSPLDKTWLSAEFRTLSKESLKLILGSDKLVVQSENTVFNALMAWIEWNLGAIDGDHSLLSLVRFELMSVGFMYDIVRHHTTAKRLSGFNEFLQNGLAYHAFSPSRSDELEIKPVNRCTYSNKDQTFSLVLDQDKQRELIERGMIWSSVFWCKGYMLRLKLRYAGTTYKSYTLFLFVQNLEKGHVKISFRARSELFASIVMQSAIATYTCSSKGFGQRAISDIAPSIEPNTITHTIDVWVDIK